MKNALFAIENSILKPIERQNLSSRMAVFVSIFHFAFGDKKDRDVAIASWVNDLSEFPEWAIKQGLEDFRTSYKGEGVLTVGMVIDRIRYYLGDAFKMRDKIKMIFREGLIFTTQEEYAEYKNKKHEKIKQSRVQREGSLQKLSKIKADLNADNEKKYNEGQKIIEKMKADQLAEWQSQRESMKIFKEKNRQINRLDELYEEFEQIVLALTKTL